MPSVWTPKHPTKQLRRVAYREGGRESPIKYATGWIANAEAQEKKRELKKQFNLQKLAGRAPCAATPIVALLESWGRQRLSHGHCRPAWVKKVKRIVTQLAEELEWTYISDITAASLNDWIDRQAKITLDMAPEAEAHARLNTKGVRDPLAKTQMFLNWAKTTQEIAVHEGALAVRLGAMPDKKEWPLLTVEQVTAILVRAVRVGGFSCATAFEHMALYGCRRGDLCRALISDWNSAEREITYRNTKNNHTIKHIVHEAHALKLDRCAEGRDPSAHLFLDPYGQPWRFDVNGSASYLGTWYTDNISSEAVPSHPGIYHLKKFGMTRLVIAARGNRKLVITMSGHRTQKMVDTYTMANREGQAELINAVAVVSGYISEPVLERAAKVIDTRPLVTPEGGSVPLFTNPKRYQGFQSLSDEQRSRIARLGWEAAKKTGKLAAWTPEQAREMNAKYGFATMDPARRKMLQTIGGLTKHALATRPEAAP